MNKLLYFAAFLMVLSCSRDDALVRTRDDALQSLTKWDLYYEKKDAAYKQVAQNKYRKASQCYMEAADAADSLTRDDIAAIERTLALHQLVLIMQRNELLSKKQRPLWFSSTMKRAQYITKRIDPVKLQHNTYFLRIYNEDTIYLSKVVQDIF